MAIKSGLDYVAMRPTRWTRPRVAFIIVATVVIVGVLVILPKFL
jgi:hypothetical protein